MYVCDVCVCVSVCVCARAREAELFFFENVYRLCLSSWSGMHCAGRRRTRGRRTRRRSRYTRLALGPRTLKSQRPSTFTLPPFTIPSHYRAYFFF